MIHYDFESSIGYWLTITNQALQRAFNDELTPTGITYRQSQVIAWLSLDPELTPGELACRMMIEPPTLAGILDRMEGTGWIAREECAEDRRRKQIRLTPAAEPVWEQIVSCMLRVRGRMVAGLSGEQIEQFRDLLRCVHENLTGETLVPTADAASLN